MEDPSTLWTLLLFCGYLTVKASHFQGRTFMYELKVRNHEVMIQYETVFRGWLKQAIGSNHYAAFLSDVVEGRIAVFLEKLTRYLLSCTSTHDFHHESHYHTFVLGLVSGITATHHVVSNQEAGIGLPDLVLIPKDPHQNQGFILEFKQIPYHKQAKAHRLHVPSLLNDAHQAVLEALNQMNDRAYDPCFLPYPHITNVVKIGIAFAKRLVSAASITTPIETIRQTNPVLTDNDMTFYDAQHDDEDTEKIP